MANEELEEQRKEERLPDVMEVAYKAIRKSDGAPAICVTRAMHYDTKAKIVVFGLFDDDEATDLTFLEEDAFYQNYVIEGPFTYQYSINAENIGATTDTSGGSSIVAEATTTDGLPPTQEPEHVCKCGECGCHS